MKCSVCGAEATFVVRGGLCTLHWCQWWVRGMGYRSPRKRYRVTRMLYGHTKRHLERGICLI